MTQSIAENSVRDMYLGDDGNIAFNSAADAVGQLCKSRIEAQRSEMMYAMNDGMPTRATAWDQFNPAQFQTAMFAIVLATPDVISITTFSITVQDNTLVYSITIQTTYGTTTVNSQ